MNKIGGDTTAETKGECRMEDWGEEEKKMVTGVGE